MSAESKGPPRVVVTGMGVASPLGCEVPEFWAKVTSGVVATAPVTRFSTAGYPTDQAAEVDPAGLDEDGLDGAAALPRSVRYAHHATARALAEAGLTGPEAAGAADPRRAGIVLGTVMGTRPHLEELRRRGRDLGEDPSWDTPQLLAASPARRFALHGPRQVVGAGCAAGNTALSLAADLIRSGRAEVMVAGGVDELSEAVFQLFTTLRAVAPDRARPFDRDRRGMLPSEGAAVLVLESLDHARRRGATPLAELRGWSVAAEAYHMTAPHPEGRGIRRCMEQSLARAELTPRQVDHVSAHGTGTPASDGLEALCLAEYFGTHGGRPGVSSVKGMLGHAQGGASALEAVVCVQAVRTGVVPGNPTMREPDGKCADLDLIPGTHREQPVHTALSNAFGFGGNTSTVVFSTC
ncbi:beta-ketoacyl-[acyl-carrier-protein] synthase family protein [Streptomyces physcomitrii]|uniref:Beta-ketoacyl-[acyl-carrier-protein] synthase family protein n=1 Tax=Streptomyces physcomitrii TaxID=2724184 RepID=A0ABX1H0H1_9ACTN|nr:beta-ketoacyl-[acyl-carrier-protein] synthase family protein [Streptomyces physcomitrii]NKI41527.1 beta-ketoacyl-[acyl-carrier-protein] synthase family protein [Streptomyces physcomitrii]